MLILSSSALAVPVELKLTSYSPATLPAISTIINLPDTTDQLEISRQAILFALSPEGWDLGNLGGSLMKIGAPGSWTGDFWILRIYGQSDEVEALYGYEMNPEVLPMANTTISYSIMTHGMRGYIMTLGNPLTTLES